MRLPFRLTLITLVIIMTAGIMSIVLHWLTAEEITDTIPRSPNEFYAIYATNTQIAIWNGQTLTAFAQNTKTTPVWPTQSIEQERFTQIANAIRATNVYIIQFTQKTQTAQAVTKTSPPTNTPTPKRP